MKKVTRTEKEATKTLRALEEKYNLLSYQIDGLAYWMCLRFSLHRKLMGVTTSARRGKNFRQILIALKEVTSYWFPPKTDFIFHTASTFSERQNNIFKDIYFDDLLFTLKNALKVEVINSFPFYYSKTGNEALPARITTSYINFLSKKKAMLSPSKAIKAIANEISTAIIKDLPAMSITYKWVRNELSVFHWRRQTYARFFRKAKAKAVLTYRTDDYPVFAAAKDCGIPCYEYQHGVFTEHHPDILWSYMSKFRNSLIAPDKLLVFGPFWRQQLLKNNYYLPHEIIAVGNPRIDRYRHLRASNNSKITNIVLSTQGELNRKTLLDFIEQFLMLADSSGVSICLSICLHPRNDLDKRPYMERFGNRSDVIIKLGAEEPSIYKLLIDADYHMSIYSATLFDSLGLEVPTIVLGLTGYETVSQICEEGDALLARTPEDLFQIISNRKVPVKNDSGYKYYTPDFHRNIMNLLDII